MSKFSKTFNPTLKNRQEFALKMIKLITELPIGCHNCTHFLNLDKHNILSSVIMQDNICDIDAHSIIDTELEFNRCNKFENDGALLYWLREYIKLTNNIYAVCVGANYEIIN